MKFLILIVLLFVSFSYGVSNFTINGETELNINPKDSLEIKFDFETIGSSVDIMVLAYLPVVGELELYRMNNAIIDGGVMDETDADGAFEKHLTNFISANDDITFIVRLIEGETSADVSCNFNIPESSFSISGSVHEESEYGNTPLVFGVLPILYNADANLILELVASSSLEEILEVLGNDRLFIIDTIFMGSYSTYIPDDIENVSIILSPKSPTEFTAPTLVSPDWKYLEVNGEVDGVDFLYQLPDAFFNGTVKNNDGEIVSNGIVSTVRNGNILSTASVKVNSEGGFSIPLLNGSYIYNCIANGYNPYQNVFILTGTDYYNDIVLDKTVSIDEQIAENFKLYQNYPNPFNPSSTIGFHLEKRGSVKLSIFNENGELVTSLVDRDLSRGEHEVEFDGTNLNSGVYFYKLSFDGNTITKRMVLLK